MGESADPLCLLIYPVRRSSHPDLPFAALTVDQRLRPCGGQREVYDEEYVEAAQPFYPGDRVEVIRDVKVKEIENTKGMQGVVTHYEFDDGYESCQTCSTSCPVTVLLDEVQ